MRNLFLQWRKTFSRVLGVCACLAVCAVADDNIVKIDQSPHANMHGVDFDSVRWTEGFWAERYEQTRKVTLRRLWELAADPEAGHVLDNMRAAGTGEGDFAGTNWQDAWLYKWIEAAACVHKATGDPWIAEPGWLCECCRIALDEL